MESNISAHDKELFWLKLYFDLSAGYRIAAIKRAYRDFNRTLEIMPKDEELRKKIRESWVIILIKRIDVMLQNQFVNQEGFDEWHQSTCFSLRTAHSDFPLSQGQAQKWINMSLKYLFLIGPDRIPNIMRNYRYFHIPIDNIIMDKLEEQGIARLPGVWSKIKDYDSYFRYQSDIRNKYQGQIPMDVEFKLFSESYNNEIL